MAPFWAMVSVPPVKMVVRPVAKPEVIWCALLVMLIWVLPPGLSTQRRTWPIASMIPLNTMPPRITRMIE